MEECGERDVLMGDYVSEYEDFPYVVGRYDDNYDVQYEDHPGYCEPYCRPAGVVTAGVMSSIDPAAVAAAGVALSVTSDGDVTASVASMGECGESYAALSDCVCDYDDYFYDGQYDDHPDNYDYDDPDDYGVYLSINEFDEPDDYELYHDLHDSNGCGEYCVSHGAVNADVSSSSENMRLEVLRGDVALSRTGLEESSAALETSVVGAVGSGAPWYSYTRDRGAAETQKEIVVDSECRETVRRALDGERMCVADPLLVSAA